MNNDPEKHDEEKVGVTVPANDEVDNIGRPVPEADGRAYGQDQEVTYLDAPAVNFGTEQDEGES